MSRRSQCLKDSVRAYGRAGDGVNTCKRLRLEEPTALDLVD
ncbi:MAG: hypothetical protein ACYSUC_04410 [Planctomycetota bacterium]